MEINMSIGEIVKFHIILKMDLISIEIVSSVALTMLM